jgi:hypothetical protein
VNAPEPLIADALREIAAGAPAPRPMAGAAWQAGRRRRWRALAAAVTAGAGAIAAVIALTLAVTDSPAGPPGRPPSVALAPVSLSTPIQFRQVASISTRACPAGSSGVPGPAAAPAGNPNPPGMACYKFTGKGMTVTGLRSAAVVHQPGGGYLLDITFTRGDAARFAALTGRLAGRPTPRCELAVIIGGRVISSPIVDQPITQGQAQITGFTSRAQVEQLLGWG